MKTRMARVAELVCEEMIRGAKDHGVYASLHEAYAVILEELDEAWEQVKRNATQAAVMEFLHVAATAQRVVMEYMEGLPDE